ncbi:MAG: Signal peptide peptidase SppA [Actinobacteria bacterium]|nr:Signal peptide peptidase SppA [Actinomycetota bacterium]
MNMETSLPAQPGRRPFLRGCAIIVIVFAGFFLLLGLLSRMDGMSFGSGDKVAVLPITGLIAE